MRDRTNGTLYTSARRSAIDLPDNVLYLSGPRTGILLK